MSDFLGIHGTALALREQRLQLLSANIANADTPGYKAVDLDFNRAMFRLQLDAGRLAEADKILQTMDGELRRLGPLVSGVTRQQLLEELDVGSRARLLLAHLEGLASPPSDDRRFPPEFSPN